MTSETKSDFICDNIPTKAILVFFGCSEVNNTWLITSELTNQRARKVLFTCVVYTDLCLLSRTGGEKVVSKIASLFATMAEKQVLAVNETAFPENTKKVI